MAKFWNLVSQATGGMRPPPPPDAPRRPLALVGGDGRVIADLPCHQCGYDVRGLSIDGSCPECNFPVRHSVRGNVLIYSDPRWLRRVARGAKWMGWAGVIGFIAGVTWVGTFSGLAAIVFLATVATFLAGAWMTTTADPSGIDDARSGRLRLTARSLLIAGLFVAPVAQLRGHVPIPEGMIRTATWLLLACGFGGAIALLRCFQRMTLRMPDGRLFAALEQNIRTLLVTVAAATVSIVFLNMFPAAAPRVPKALLCVLCLPLLALLVVSWQFLSICRELAGTLHDLANVAERLWPAETGGPADTTIASTERA
jgi:hypothetical protein